MKRTRSVLIIVIISISFFTVIDLEMDITTNVSGANVLYVGGVGSGNHSTINSAIDSAEENDTIFVYNGIYYENLIINKSLKLNGESSEGTIIDGDERICIQINTNYVTVENFTIKNGAYGIKIYSQNNIITNNRILGIQRGGIYIYNSSNTISNNILLQNSIGFKIYYYSENDISGNIISDNRISISFYEAPHNIVLNNTFTNNFWGIMIQKSPDITITENTFVANAIFDIYLSKDDDYIKYAPNNYFGTNLESQIEKRFYGSVDFSNWLDYRPLDVQYINTSTIWNNSIVIEKGVIVNHNLTIENATITFNNSLGQNYIFVKGNMTVINSTFINKLGNYTIQYLNGSNGRILNSELNGQRGLVLQSERGMPIDNSSISNGESGIIITGGKSYSITNCKINRNSWSGYYNYSDLRTNSSSSIRIGIYIISFAHNNIFLSSATNNSIRNCEIIGCDYIGLYLRNSSNNTISECTISDNFLGVDLYLSHNNKFSDLNVSGNYEGFSITDSDENIIGGSTISFNVGHGCELDGSSFNNINNSNIISNGGTGIKLDDFSYENSVVESNVSLNDWYGIYIFNSPRTNLTKNVFWNNNATNLRVKAHYKNEFMEQFIDETNTVNGKTIYYLFQLSDQVVEFPDAGHITMAHCNKVILQYSNVIHGDGLHLMYSPESVVQYCNSSYNHIGIEIDGDSNYTIHHNNFIDNLVQIEEQASDVFLDNGKVGNYWSDYTGEDLDGDWIGDRPYIVKHSLDDDHPLIYPLYLDAPAPNIVVTDPSNHDNDVRTDTSISITFSKKMNTGSAENAFSISPSINIIESRWIDNDRTLIITTPKLDTDTNYRVKINTNITDVEGNPLLLPYQFSFSTEENPEIISTTPRRDATDIPVNTSIIIRFSKEMNKTSVERYFSISPENEEISFEWRNENTTLLILLPTLKHRFTYTVSINMTASDPSGNPLTSTYTWKFTTEKKEPSDDIPWAAYILSAILGVILFYLVYFLIMRWKKPSQ